MDHQGIMMAARSMLLKVVLALVLIALAFHSPLAGQSSSRKYTPRILDKREVYVPDYSYAGYHWGEKPIPTSHAGRVFMVTDYGADGGDEIDDTAAVLRTLKQAHNHPGPVTVKFPRGKFILRQVLWIKRGDLVIQGEGSDPKGTVLFFPVAMKDMDLPPAMDQMRQRHIDNNKRVRGKLYSIFSWEGGVIWASHDEKREYTKIHLRKGTRGTHRIVVADPSRLDESLKERIVQVRWRNSGRTSSLTRHIVDNQNVPIGSYYDQLRTLNAQRILVAGVEADTIVVKEPLAHDISEDWTSKLAYPKLHKEVGIEHLRIEFPLTEYKGHHLEEGYNGLFLENLVHSWVDDVTIVNADSAILSEDSKNVTIRNVEIEGRRGHYSISFGDCNYMLAKNFRIGMPALHNPSFNSRSMLNVFTNGDIKEARLDRHLGFNNQNLFDNLRVTAGDAVDLFDSGGSKPLMSPTGAFNTFWNISYRAADSSPVVVRENPSARLVGIYGNVPIDLTYGPNGYLEGINRPGINIPSLYEYQLERRLSRH
jgi:hypothetical protein